jgi:SAM-dependent methyltransferase
MANNDPASQGTPEQAPSESRWDPSNAGNRLILEERTAIAIDLLGRRGLWPPGGYRVLEIGCGSGYELSRFVEWGADPSELLGVDVDEERIRTARAARPDVAFLVGDATQLDLPDASYRLVLVFTVLSSVLDDALQEAIAKEIDRVLEPSGCVLWYDFRLSHPANPNTRGVRARRLRELFPAYEIDLRLVTVVPPFVRRLGRLAKPVYPLLRLVPILRTHYLGTFVKRDVLAPAG